MMIPSICIAIVKFTYLLPTPSITGANHIHFGEEYTRLFGLSGRFSCVRMSALNTQFCTYEPH